IHDAGGVIREERSVHGAHRAEIRATSRSRETNAAFMYVEHGSVIRNHLAFPCGLRVKDGELSGLQVDSVYGTGKKPVENAEPSVGAHGGEVAEALLSGRRFYVANRVRPRVQPV